METRRRHPDTLQLALLEVVKHRSEIAARAERERNAAIRAASDGGCSLRQIADASGIPHMTVKRIIDRHSTVG